MSLVHKDLVEKLTARKAKLVHQLNTAPLTYADFREIQELYALSYSMFHDVQKHSKATNLNLVPVGDQITGVLGEAYIIRYLSRKFPSANMSPAFTKNSTTSRDIEYAINKGRKIKVEVKTTSFYSESRSSTPIGDQWRELYFVYLDQDLNPTGAWKIKPTYRTAFLKYLSGVTSRKIRIQDPSKKQSGTPEVFVDKVRYATDITTEFLQLM